uniref:Transposase n=1 Tax=Ascaris lumbricoides TaxID=6252 RepID=A0A0M3I677_ASCLU
MNQPRSFMVFLLGIGYKKPKVFTELLNHNYEQVLLRRGRSSDGENGMNAIHGKPYRLSDVRSEEVFKK